MQLVALRHDTPLRPLVPLLGLGVVDQCCPSHVRIRVLLAAFGPLWPTATQNTGLAQETSRIVLELSPGIAAADQASGGEAGDGCREWRGTTGRLGGGAVWEVVQAASARVTAAAAPVSRGSDRIIIGLAFYHLPY
jgi:hypothetical protein